MDIDFAIWTDPKAKLPSGTGIELKTAGSGGFIAFPPPGQIQIVPINYPAPYGSPDDQLSMSFMTGTRRPMRFEASGLTARIALLFNILAGTSWDPRNFFVGNIVHPVRGAAATRGCTVTCFDQEGSHGTEGDGYCCVICENEDAVIKICC